MAPQPDPVLVQEYADALSLSPVVVGLALQRGFTDQNELEQFLYPRLKDLGNLFSLPGVEDAVSRIFRAIDGRP